MSVKTCIRCSEVKPVSEYGKNASKRDGLSSYCKTCLRILSAASRVVNREKRNAASAAWRAANPEKVKENYAMWRAKNRDNEIKRCAKWRAENPEKNKASYTAWAKANPDSNRVKLQNRRVRKRESGGRLSPDLAKRLLKLQRGKCACGCRQPLGDDYHLDHIMPLALGGSNADDNIQLLRAECNLRKSAKHPVNFMQERGFLL